MWTSALSSSLTASRVPSGEKFTEERTALARCECELGFAHGRGAEKGATIASPLASRRDARSTGVRGTSFNLDQMAGRRVSFKYEPFAPCRDGNNKKPHCTAPG